MAGARLSGVSLINHTELKPSDSTPSPTNFQILHPLVSPPHALFSFHSQITTSARCLPAGFRKQPLPHIKQLHHCTHPFPPSSYPTFLHSSSYLLLAVQDFTTRKSQHLQSGFRLLLSLRLFLQALLAICGFFRFCYSCLYCVGLDVQ